MGQLYRDPCVCEVGFVCHQSPEGNDTSPSLPVAIFREIIPPIPPNLPQSTPSFLSRVRSHSGTDLL